MTDKPIFISYSRRDDDFVNRLFRDLDSDGFKLWRDVEDLKPGTPSWERSIREAIKRAGAVVFVASPSSLHSDYVQGELALAKYYNCPIYPIWANGEEWIDCAPLDMVNYQYLDARNNKYSDAFETLSITLSKLFDTNEGVIRLGLPTHEVITLNLAPFDSGFHLLSHIWINYLQPWYEVFSYGREWVIGNVETKQVLLPLEWLRLDSSNRESTKMMNLLMISVFYRDFGIKDGSYWAVWDARRLKAAALFVNKREHYDRVISSNGMSELNALLKENKLVRVPLSDVVKHMYTYTGVFAIFYASDDRMAFIERV